MGEGAARLVAKRYAYTISPRTLAILRRVDAQTDAVNALAKRREDAKNAMRRAKAKKRPTVIAADPQDAERGPMSPRCSKSDSQHKPQGIRLTAYPSAA